MNAFHLQRRVTFYETDAMGVVHHSNYLRYFEESRVAWLHHRKLEDLWKSQGVAFAVMESQVFYRRPLKFDDVFDVLLQIRREGAKYRFKYAICKDDEVMATGMTLHVPVDKSFKVCKAPPQMVKILEMEPWTETWP